MLFKKNIFAPLPSKIFLSHSLQKIIIKQINKNGNNEHRTIKIHNSN
jgi:hypothetical protein